MAAEGYDGPGWYWVDGEEDPVFVTYDNKRYCLRIYDVMDEECEEGYCPHMTKIDRPIHKPIVDWSSMPAWANWVAINHIGSWFWCTDKPEIINDMWHGSAGTFGIIPEENAPTYNGDWKNSLVERPR